MKSKDIFDELKNIDRLIHEPSRMAILALLLVVDEADFVFVMNKTGLSQGNLSSHLSKLEEAKLVDIEKKFKGKRPQTILRISKKGKEEFQNYLIRMKIIYKNI